MTLLLLLRHLGAEKYMARTHGIANSFIKSVFFLEAHRQPYMRHNQWPYKYAWILLIILTLRLCGLGDMYAASRKYRQKSGGGMSMGQNAQAAQ